MTKDKNGRWLRRCGWCGVPCYGTTCKLHAHLDKKLKAHQEGK